MAAGAIDLSIPGPMQTPDHGGLRYRIKWGRQSAEMLPAQ